MDVASAVGTNIQYALPVVVAMPATAAVPSTAPAPAPAPVPAPTPAPAPVDAALQGAITQLQGALTQLQQVLASTQASTGAATITPPIPAVTGGGGAYPAAPAPTMTGAAGAPIRNWRPARGHRPKHGSAADPSKGTKKQEKAGGKSADPATAKQLEKVLREKHSPLAKHVDTIMSAAAKYGIDPRLLVAISGTESGYGQKTFRPFNAWGMMTDKQFSSWDEGINEAARLLGKDYVGEGLTSLAKIGAKWCPDGGTWVNMTTPFLKELGGNPSDVRA